MNVTDTATRFQIGFLALTVLVPDRQKCVYPGQYGVAGPPSPWPFWFGRPGAGLEPSIAEHLSWVNASSGLGRGPFRSAVGTLTLPEPPAHPWGPTLTVRAIYRHRQLSAENVIAVQNCCVMSPR